MWKQKAIVASALTMLLLAGCSNDEKDTAKKEEEAKQEAIKKLESKIVTNTQVELAQKPSTQNAAVVSQKVVYTEKLNEVQLQIEEIRKKSASGVTIEMKAAESEVYELVDPLLNEIYEVLKNQLTEDEFKKVQEEQRKWITERDEAALKASKEYEGGTHEQLEYQIVSNDLTMERNKQLVELYMQ